MTVQLKSKELLKTDPLRLLALAILRVWKSHPLLVYLHQLVDHAEICLVTQQTIKQASKAWLAGENKNVIGLLAHCRSGLVFHAWTEEIAYHDKILSLWQVQSELIDEDTAQAYALAQAKMSGWQISQEDLLMASAKVLDHHPLMVLMRQCEEINLKFRRLYRESRREIERGNPTPIQKMFVEYGRHLQDNEEEVELMTYDQIFIDSAVALAELAHQDTQLVDLPSKLS